MNILLDDQGCKEKLFPFGQVKSVAHIRVGILTIFEKWQFYFPGKVFVVSESLNPEQNPDGITFPANLVPSQGFLHQLSVQEKKLEVTPDCTIIEYPWQIFEFNDWAIREDFKMISAGRTSERISATNGVVNSGDVFIEPGAKVNFCVLNAENGPIYIGKDADVQEGSLLRGPVSIGENSRVKMGTKIYGATTIGPHCLVGGEIKNSVLTAWSNKAHDGYLGDSVLGEWCNLGAGTSNSNLKNNASEVKIWSKSENKYLLASKKCGLLMGDYSRSAINTSFNTGTVVGVCCNVFGDSFPPKFIDNFSWGKEKYIFEKAITDISNWKKLKNESITEFEIQSLKQLYQ